MNVHYINILLFAHALNILVNTHKKLFISRHHTQDIPTIRSLCECELYVPANYDNDQEMKSVMENFNKQTEERFHEYDERMKTTRQKCKEQCDKEIQKIILKDKLEKQMAQKLATLETNIDIDDIPTFVCKKSLSDKVEKNCLLCGGMLSGGIAPNVGLFGAVDIGAWKTTKIAAAIAAAKEEGALAGKAAHDSELLAKFIEGLETLNIDKLFTTSLEPLFITTPYNESSIVPTLINTQYNINCAWGKKLGRPMCEEIGAELGVLANPGQVSLPLEAAIAQKLNGIVAEAKGPAAKAAEAATKRATEAAIKTKSGAIEAATTPYYTPIIASIIAIEVIVLIMVIIYLILRYRRKKKMKKKLQYIKLLEE
ncbi:rifin PIR protein, putative [Plasmodium reichenowi]|uniref:Rifin PIR protein, putative n=1 Tax=Plasmodium reichenowi TaxID=5854 RepID=A0A2P9DCD9_PLARE|nr:rifin PIR protein, putative [Plasmodium reichenowi]